MSPTKRGLEILVHGCGAVGTAFAWRAAQSQARITIVCRSNFNAAKQSGFRISRDTSSQTFLPHRVVRHSSEVSHVHFDYVILASQRLEGINPRDIAPAVEKSTALLSVQNGLGADCSLHELFPANPILGGICYVNVVRSGLGAFQEVAQIAPHAFQFGLYSTGIDNTGPSKFRELASLHPSFHVTDDLQLARWTKMVWNAAWNPATAIFNMNTQEILADRRTTNFVLRLAEETVQIGRAAGIQLPVDAARQSLEATRQAPAIVPSMLRESRRNRPIELNAICGTLLRIADTLVVSVPTLREAYARLSRFQDHTDEEAAVAISPTLNAVRL